MAKFNVSGEQERIPNEAGGTGYLKSPRLELTLLALTSFVQDQHYRSAETMLKRMTTLAKETGIVFAAKAAIYVRRSAHMRSISHAIAAQVGVMSARELWLRTFFKRVVERPDDILEILAAFQKMRGLKGKLRRLPKGMQKGLADALASFSPYQLAKYRGEGKQISLIDAVRLLHPAPTDRNREAFEKLVKGTLVATETWETKLTQAGQKGETEEQVAELKGSAWSELIDADKLGYMAMLRNLRNIATQAPTKLEAVLARLAEPARVRGSKQLPFRFLTAYDEFTQSNVQQPIDVTEILVAISKAATISLENMPELPGKTLVALDASGSMGGDREMDRKSPWHIGRLFAAALALRNRADILIWGDRAEGYRCAPGSMIVVAAELLNSKYQNGGTNISLVYEWIHECAKQKLFYDRVIVLTDSQSWIGDPEEARRRAGAATKLPSWWTFDLQGYSTLQVKENGSFVVGGFSDKVLEVMGKVESDPKALIAEIENVPLMEELARGTEVTA
jgi:hypothetical protein